MAFTIRSEDLTEGQNFRTEEGLWVTAVTVTAHYSAGEIEVQTADETFYFDGRQALQVR